VFFFQLVYEAKPTDCSACKMKMVVFMVEAQYKLILLCCRQVLNMWCGRVLCTDGTSDSRRWQGERPPWPSHWYQMEPVQWQCHCIWIWRQYCKCLFSISHSLLI